jgi:hypothetical protein
MTRRDLPCVLGTAMMIAVSGCMSTGEGRELAGDSDTVRDVESTRIALRTGASAGPDELDGFCEDGAGVFLSAYGETADLTIYVVAPAETVTFERPALRLTTMLDGRPTTDISEFEDVTLHAGESRVFTAQTVGTLMDVVAEIGPSVLPE